MLVCCVALSIGYVSGASADGRQERGAGAAQVKLKRCGNIPEPSGFRCGSIEVPFERSDPSYGSTRIAFALRTRDRDTRPSLGTIFAQEGGPGFASTGTANAYTKLFAELLERRDLVLVDMRGTGRSERIDCPGLQHGIGPVHHAFGVRASAR
jgi:hypothetical protein